MTKSKKSSDGLKTVFWWVVWMTLTIASFFVACFFWTPIIAAKFGPIHQMKTSIIWVSMVFGTWILFLVPLIIVMYAKVDKAYEDARMKREKAQLRFKTLNLPKNLRTLPSHLAKKLNEVPETIESGHLVSIILKNGKKFPYVFVASRSEIIGIYDQKELPFTMNEIEDIRPETFENAPRFLTTQWLRLDGVSAAD